MARKRISRFLLNEKFSGLSGLSGHVPNYALHWHTWAPLKSPRTEPPNWSGCQGPPLTYLGSVEEVPVLSLPNDQVVRDLNSHTWAPLKKSPNWASQMTRLLGLSTDIPYSKPNPQTSINIVRLLLYLATKNRNPRTKMNFNLLLKY